MKLPWEEIEELTKYLKEKGLGEITIETKDGKITVKKDAQGVVKTTSVPAKENLQKQAISKPIKKNNDWEEVQTTEKKSSKLFRKFQ